MNKLEKNSYVAKYIEQQTAIVSCEYKKVSFRNAISQKADELAKEYIEQANKGLLTWGELGEKLTELRSFEKETLKAIETL